MNKKMIADIKSRLTTSAVAGLAVLSVVTLIIVSASLSEPGPYALGDVAHYYSNLVGAIVGWIWMTVAISVQVLDDGDNDPILATAIFAVGLGLVFIFNTIIIGDFQPALILQVIGYVLLIIDGMGMGFYLFYLDPEQRTKIVQA